MTFIGKKAFYNCDSLEYFNFPVKLKTLEDYAFGYCNELEELEIPKTLIKCHDKAFKHMYGLKKIILNEGVEKWLTAYNELGSLEEVSIPSTLSHIDPKDMENMYHIKRFNVSLNNPFYTAVDGVLLSRDKKTIIKYPSSKKGIYRLPKSVESIHQYAFRNTPNPIKISVNEAHKINKKAYVDNQNIEFILNSKSDDEGKSH